MGRKRTSPVNVLFGWQSTRVKAVLGVTTAVLAFVALKFFVKTTHHFYLASESIHAAGIFALGYKLISQKTCSGLSLKTQELTGVYVGVRIISGVMIDHMDTHIMLDALTFIATLWVIYMIRFKLKSTYIQDLDTVPHYYLVVPSVILALFMRPVIGGYISEGLWAFSTYLEAVAVWPQLRLMQNVKMIEPFTSHYVFALGVARFLSCVHWIIMVYETRGRHFYLITSGYFWVPVALAAEIVQTFILADFCYYYLKRSLLVMRGNSADMAGHVMCPSSSNRVSITFFRVRPESNHQSPPTSPMDSVMTLWQPAIPTPYPLPNGTPNGYDTMEMIPSWGVVRTPIVMLSPMCPMVLSPKNMPNGGTGVCLPWAVGSRKPTKHLPPCAQKGRFLALSSPVQKHVADSASESGTNVEAKAA